MPDNSNSTSVAIRHVISNVVATMTYHPLQFCPTVKIDFRLQADDEMSGTSQIIMSKMQYCLMPYSDGTYGIPDENTVWTDVDVTSKFAANGTMSYYWSSATRAYLQSSNSGLNNSIFWNIKNDLPNQDGTKQLYVRFTLKTSESQSLYPGQENIGDASGNTIITTLTTKEVSGNRVNTAIKTTNPYLTSLVENKKYTNSDSFIVELQNFSPDVEFLAYRVNSSGLSTWTPRTSDNKVTISLKQASSDGNDLTDGKYVVKIVARDEFYNYYAASDADFVDNTISFETTRATIAPFDCELNIYAQDGNSRYAGIRINTDGSFTPDRAVNVIFFGNSNLPMTCRIYSNGREVLIPGVEVSTSSDGTITGVTITEIDESNPSYDTGMFNYKSTYAQDKARIINQLECELVGEDYDVSELRSITIVFTDIAGNETSVTKTIMLNNRIFKCAKKNLRESSSEYTHVVMKENSYGAFDTIPESAETDSDNYKRMWDDIYFPEKHGPKMSGKSIDLEWARAAYKQYVTSGKHNYSESDEYDIFEMVKDSEKIYQPKYDSEGRVSTVWNSAKNYSPYVSRNRADMWFRVIDNTGYGDVTVQFERFDMMATPGDIENSAAGGYRGDVVMIYNADNDNCLTKIQNADGSITYPSSGVNTVLMELLAVYSGVPGSVYDWLSGQAVKTNDTTGAFEETFQCSRICVIVCTDSSKEKSGFKIKGGNKIGLVYSNYDVDEINGELWYHGESDDWGSTNKKMRMFYDYYDSSVSYDYDRGRVIMNINDIPADAIMTCDYTYYKHKNDYTSEDKTRMFISSEDDYYDYLTPIVYVTPRGLEIDKSGPIYVPGATISGKFTDSYWVVDKDRGLIEINKAVDTDGDAQYGLVPFNKDSNGNDSYPMRMTMDYVHHTFYRLSNDGYGNVTFEDKVIVADSTPVYPDATWADIRIINEGDAILEAGKLVFKSRGETDSGSDAVKKPLDVNRPWDVQEGKKAVTWDRCRVYLSYTYDENYFQFTPSISNLRKTYNTAVDNNTGASLRVSASNPYLAPKEALYGRIVWNLAGPTGTNLTNVNYPTDGLILGRKSWSCEISGKYYIVKD